MSERKVLPVSDIRQQRASDAESKRKLGVIIITISFFAIGIMVGTQLRQSGSITGTPFDSLPGFFTDGIAKSDIKVDSDLSLYWDVWQTIKDNYVDEEALNDEELYYGSIKGLVNSLGDPATIFLDPEETKAFNEGNAGNYFSGIGAELGYESGQVVVIAPIDGSPAQTAGLRPGDIILAVDGEDIKSNDSLFDVVLRIRGQEGTKVTLTISHEGESQSKDIEIIRGQITVPSMKLLDTENPQIVQLDLSRFTEATLSSWEKKWDETVSEVVSSGADALIVDLRSNPGGYFDAAVYAANEFLPLNTIVAKQHDRDGKIVDYKVTRDGKLLNIPVVVLVNEGSASASEILAGALRDNDRAYIMGEKTYGKGTAQNVIDFEDGSTLHLTILKWLLPDGSWLNRDNPIVPDKEVLLSELDFKEGNDPQLDAALNYLEQELE